jgi:hypothetical protein
MDTTASSFTLRKNGWHAEGQRNILFREGCRSSEPGVTAWT